MPNMTHKKFWYGWVIDMMQFFTPIKGCRIVASASNPSKNKFDFIGTVIKVEGNIAWYKDRSGETDLMIWRFKEGNNKYVYFGA